MIHRFVVCRADATNWYVSDTERKVPAAPGLLFRDVEEATAAADTLNAVYGAHHLTDLSRLFHSAEAILGIVGASIA